MRGKSKAEVCCGLFFFFLLSFFFLFFFWFFFFFFLFCFFFFCFFFFCFSFFFFFFFFFSFSSSFPSASSSRFFFFCFYFGLSFAPSPFTLFISFLSFNLPSLPTPSSPHFRYRDEGAAEDASSISSLEAKLVSEVDNFGEMARVAEKVIEQSKQEVKDRHANEKQRAIDDAASEMNRRRGKGIHR